MMCTSKQLQVLLQEYMYRESVRLEDDLLTLENNIVVRKADPLDHLEFIMAKTRSSTADKIFNDPITQSRS